METPSETASTVITEAPEQLLEKFEVVSQPETIRVKKLIAQSVPIKISQIPIQIIPTDYPKILIAVNERAEKIWKDYRSNHIPNEKLYLEINYIT